MATVNMHMYDLYRKDLLLGTSIDLLNIPLKFALLRSTYTLDINNHGFWSEVLAYEVSGVNYTAGGNLCANPTVVMDGAGLITVDAGDPNVWTQDIAGGFDNADRAVLYGDTGVAATSPLIAYGEPFALDRGNKSGAFACAFAGTGIFNIPRGI